MLSAKSTYPATDCLFLLTALSGLKPPKTCEPPGSVFPKKSVGFWLAAVVAVCGFPKMS